MSLGMQAALALFPIALGGVLLVGFRVPAKKAMPLVYVAAVAVALGAWQMTPSRVVAASIQGLFLTFDLLFIIFGCFSCDSCRRQVFFRSWWLLCCLLLFSLGCFALGR